MSDSEKSRFRRLFYKHAPPPGSRPGTLAIPAGSPPTEVFLVQYDAHGFEERRIEDLSELGQWKTPGRVSWVDVRGLGDEARLREIGRLFGLHPLALEDAVNVPQRARSKIYEGQQVIVARMPIVTEDGGITVPQVCLLLGEHYLLTVQERFFGFFDPVRERIRAGIGPIRKSGPDYLAYALLDTLIDRFYPIVEALSDRLEELEEEVNGEPQPDTLSRIHQVRRQLVVLRRVGRPQREALASLVRERTAFVSEDTHVFLRDAHDHFAQVMELVDSSREMAVGLTEIYLSEMSNRTNEIMKVLTLMASIFIPLTFIAGIYGMNFEYMPELRTPVAYPLVLTSMGAVALGMIGYFRYRGWIGARRRRRAHGEESEPR